MSQQLCAGASRPPNLVAELGSQEEGIGALEHLTQEFMSHLRISEPPEKLVPQVGQPPVPPPNLVDERSMLVRRNNARIQDCMDNLLRALEVIKEI